jgi:hypothetical protein
MTTLAKKCTILVPPTSGGLPGPCGARRYKAGRCKDHWLDWRNARDARRVADEQRSTGTRAAARELLAMARRTNPAIRTIGGAKKLDRRLTREAAARG